MHSMYKETSQKLEAMNDIVKKNKSFEAQVRESEEMIQKLSGENSEKDEKLKDLEERLSEMSFGSATASDIDSSWSKLKQQAEDYENLLNERNELKAQLSKISGVEDLLKKLKIRADDADKLEQKVEHLERELQRCGYGAAGDKAVLNRIRSSCKYCQQYSVEINRANCMLESEIKKCNKFQAEINFLRGRVRNIDIMEAEFILYKVGCQVLKYF
jgi:DNA repair exonuclease SbcCD ATPase subunit